ncbi:MAG: response regulator transcription factor [Acidovorax sp.]|uniref:response regulator transcription factor n=1 Tax=Acidovorax sp. 106 TaxID=2135637 RepID=UPI000EAC369C|nr:response regulator transcription factor [Acidovorax sp. 106]MCZ8092860.1 response regulator transcription factor [Acidovorax sp.]RLJ39410.1 winged helix family two component transcriptional regulator [Acidovorax sp. 106]
MNRIALIEDHSRLADLVRQALGHAGIETDVFHAMEPAWLALRDITYGVVVIDRGLPDGDGLHLVKRLRAAGRPTPCLMLTARDALHDRIEGLDSGADDYLTKPFPMEELVARVRALLRRPAQVQEFAPAHGDVQISPEHGHMVCAGTAVPLPATELQIMLCLARKAGQTVKRSTLEAAAWGLTEAVTPNALDVALHRLRRKLAAAGSRMQIVNLRTQGYALREVSVAS